MMMQALNQGFRWVNMNQNFDWIGNAMMTLFEISTTEGWVDVRRCVAKGVDVRTELHAFSLSPGAPSQGSLRRVLTPSPRPMSPSQGSLRRVLTPAHSPDVTVAGIPATGPGSLPLTDGRHFAAAVTREGFSARTHQFPRGQRTFVGGRHVRRV